MGDAADFKKMKRVMLIYAFVQAFLILLLIYMSVHFQAVFQAQGKPQLFIKSIVSSLIIQLILFYPINKFAGGEAARDIAALATGLTVEELASLRRKRLVSDFIKMGVFIFFITFIARAPSVPLLQSAIFFTFILTILSYFQCYNFAAKRKLKG